MKLSISCEESNSNDTRQTRTHTHGNKSRPIISLSLSTIQPAKNHVIAHVACPPTLHAPRVSDTVISHTPPHLLATFYEHSATPPTFSHVATYQSISLFKQVARIWIYKIDSIKREEKKSWKKEYQGVFVSRENNGGNDNGQR